MKDTTARVMQALAYCILGFVFSLTMGCSTANPKTGEFSAGRSGLTSATTPSPLPPATTTNKAIRQQAADELGPEAAKAIPAVTRLAPKPVDAGAKKLVDEIAGALPFSPKSDGEIVQISLNAIRNQSRSHTAEFTAMLDRLAGLLNDAVEGSHLVFTAVASETVPYEMQGAAYLSTRDGFDFWEMYLSVSPVQRPSTLWQNNGAVWLIRQARSGQPQLLMER